MTFFSGIYSSLSGLTSFSRALNVISDNVANLNTPGYKINDVLFRDLGPNQLDFDNPSRGIDRGTPGQGVDIVALTRRFTQGETQGTSNPTDLAINGNGFFVLNVDGQRLYSRAGQFQFDIEGRLVDSVTGGFVQGIDSRGRLSDVQIDRFATLAPVPTTTVDLTGNLLPTGTNFDLANIIVFDATGASRTLSAQFLRNPAIPGGWNVTVSERGNPLITKEILFNADGTPATGFNEIQIPLSANGLESTVTLNLGSPNTFDGVTSIASGASSVTIRDTDGSGLGVFQNFAFNGQGVLQISFSNGVTQSGPQIALASFSNPESLLSVGNASFKEAAGISSGATLGTAGEPGFGGLLTQTIELANVELSREFANIVILQRGFQGSSQVLNVSSKLLEELYNNLGQGR